MESSAQKNNDRLKYNKVKQSYKALSIFMQQVKLN